MKNVVCAVKNCFIRLNQQEEMKEVERQQKKNDEYFQKMKPYIMGEISDDRHVAALAGSIARAEELLRIYLKKWEVINYYGK